MKRYCLALDLKNDPVLIKEYEQYHKNVWPEIIKSIKDSEIEALDIYRTGNRMFMIIEANDNFSFEKKLPWMQIIPKCRNGNS
jgi:L-rhamnose mutarotase